MATVQIRKPKFKDIFFNCDGGDDMAARADEVWAEVIDHLQQNDLVTKSRLGMADRYCRIVAEYERWYPEAVMKGPIYKGPNGGDVFNGLWSACDKMLERISRMEDALMISPKAGDGKIKKNKPAKKKDAASEFLG